MHSNSQSHLTRHAALLTLAGLLSACATTGGGMADASQNPLAPVSYTHLTLPTNREV